MSGPRIVILGGDKPLRLVETPIGRCYVEDPDTVIRKVDPKAVELRFPKKIPIPVWAEMVAFIRWGHTEHDGEVQLCGFTNPEGNWHWTALPQETNGMTTTEIEGPDRDAAIAEVIALGFSPDPVATIHGHCAMSAFQSGTDHADEFVNKHAGAHVTLGKTDKDEMDFDGRVKMVLLGEQLEDGTVTDGYCATGKFDISDLVEMPEVPFPHLLMATTWSALEKAFLLSEEGLKAIVGQPEGLLFPEVWKKAVVPKKFGRGSSTRRGTPGTGGFVTTYTKGADGKWVPTQAPGTGASNTGGGRHPEDDEDDELRTSSWGEASARVEASPMDPWDVLAVAAYLSSSDERAASNLKVVTDLHRQGIGVKIAGDDRVIVPKGSVGLLLGLMRMLKSGDPGSEYLQVYQGALMEALEESPLDRHQIGEAMAEDAWPVNRAATEIALGEMLLSPPVLALGDDILDNAFLAESLFSEVLESLSEPLV